MKTITDEVGSGSILVRDIADIDNLTDERTGPFRDDSDDDTAMDGKRHKVPISYRPERPPQTAIANTIDNGRSPQPANDNRPARYHLKEMAQRGDLGVNKAENRRHWFDAERLKRDIAISNDEPLSDSASSEWRELAPEYMGESLGSFDSDNGLSLSDDAEFEDEGSPNSGCSIVDNDDGEPDAIAILYSKQVVDLAKDVLGHDFKVLYSVIRDNWTARNIGENELFMDRATASACGKGMLRSALRNLSRFYKNLDGLELRGDRPLDVWPLVGSTPPTVRYPREYRHKASYMNQSRTHVVRHPASDRAVA